MLLHHDANYAVPLSSDAVQRGLHVHDKALIVAVECIVVHKLKQSIVVIHVCGSCLLSVSLLVV